MKKIFTLVAMAFMALGATAQNNTYILDINKIYQEASTASGQCTNATLSAGSKYLLNETTYTQDIFTVVSKSARTYRIDLYNPDATDEVANYGDYTATARLEPNGTANKTGGRQMFIDVANKGMLYIGAWTGTDNRALVVMPATDKTSYYEVNETSAVLYKNLMAADEKTNVYSVELAPGTYCITQGAAIYFAYVKFVEGASSGINNITNDAVNENAPVYNLAGQRVNKNTKGILIQNGKKFINK